MVALQQVKNKNWETKPQSSCTHVWQWFPIFYGFRREANQLSACVQCNTPLMVLRQDTQQRNEGAPSALGRLPSLGCLVSDGGQTIPTRMWLLPVIVLGFSFSRQEQGFLTSTVWTPSKWGVGHLTFRFERFERTAVARVPFLPLCPWAPFLKTRTSLFCLPSLGCLQNVGLRRRLITHVQNKKQKETSTLSQRKGHAVPEFLLHDDSYTEPQSQEWKNNLGVILGKVNQYRDAIPVATPS